MNKQPATYYQTDKRWKDKPYRASGETSTIGSAGCGPTCAAMALTSLTGKIITPEDTCKWAMERGYKALRQGTYYSYFKPQFAAYGLSCEQLGWENTYGKPDSPVHQRALALLREGCWLIACMGPGNWTTSGHFILVWEQDGKVRINDPASSREIRTAGDIRTFRSQVKYYWAIDAREYNKEEADMNGEQILAALSDKEAYDLLMKAQRHAATLPEPGWSQKEGHWQRAVDGGIINGANPEGVLKRDELTAILGRKGLI